MEVHSSLLLSHSLIHFPEGLKAVAMTDIVQVVLLIFGGFAVLYIALNQISGSNGVFEGLGIVFNCDARKIRYDFISR